MLSAWAFDTNAPTSSAILLPACLDTGASLDFLRRLRIKTPTKNLWNAPSLIFYRQSSHFV